jgi:hypothetical protein
MSDAEILAVLGRLQQLVDEGRITDPTVLAYVESVRERIKAGPFDEVTEAQLERLAEIVEAYRNEVVAHAGEELASQLSARRSEPESTSDDPKPDATDAA